MARYSTAEGQDNSEVIYDEGVVEDERDRSAGDRERDGGGTVSPPPLAGVSSPPLAGKSSPPLSGV